MADRFASYAALLSAIQSGSSEVFFSLRLGLDGLKAWWLKPGQGSSYYADVAGGAEPRVKEFGTLSANVSIRSRSLQAASASVTLFDNVSEDFKRHIGAGKKVAGTPASLYLNAKDSNLGMPVFVGIVDSYELNGGVLKLELRSDDNWLSRDLLHLKATSAIYRNIDPQTATSAPFVPIAIGYCPGIVPLYVSTTLFRYAVTIDRLVGTQTKAAHVSAVYVNDKVVAPSTYVLNTDRAGDCNVLNIDFTKLQKGARVTCDVIGSYTMPTLLAEFFTNGRVTGAAEDASAIFASGSFADGMLPALPRGMGPYNVSRFITSQTSPGSELGQFVESMHVGITWSLDGRLQFIEDGPLRAPAPLTTWLRNRVNFTPRSVQGKWSAREILAGLSASWDSKRVLDVADYAQDFFGDSTGSGYDPVSE